MIKIRTFWIIVDFFIIAKYDSKMLSFVFLKTCESNTDSLNIQYMSFEKYQNIKINQRVEKLKYFFLVNFDKTLRGYNSCQVFIGVCALIRDIHSLYV